MGVRFISMSVEIYLYLRTNRTSKLTEKWKTEVEIKMRIRIDGDALMTRSYNIASGNCALKLHVIISQSDDSINSGSEMQRFSPD